jgi:hypothetical protein
VFGGTEKSHFVPQIARAATCSGALRGPNWSHRPLEVQHVWGHIGPKRFHRPLDLQDVRDHREIPSGPIDH